MSTETSKTKKSAEKEIISNYKRNLFKYMKQALRALDHNGRANLMNFLHVTGEARVSNIQKAMKWPQAVTSQHLAILRRAGMVSTRRDGKNIFYSVNIEAIEKLEMFSKMATDLLTPVDRHRKAKNAASDDMPF